MKILVACEYSGNAKLTPEKMAVAKRMRDEGLTTNAIAKQIGVSRPTISRLFSGKTWGQK